MGPIPSDWHPYKKRLGHAERDVRDVGTEKRPLDNTVRRWPSANHRKRPQEKLNLPIP